DAADVLIARNNQRHALPLFTAPAAPAGASPATAFGDVAVPAPPRPLARPPRRTILTEPRSPVAQPLSPRPPPPPPPPPRPWPPPPAPPPPPRPVPRPPPRA